jgi:localization factor PodJL
MKFGVPWSVKGIRPEARETAKEAARRAGMPLGEWLNSVILEQAAQSGVAPAYDDSDDDTDSDDQSSVHHRLDELTRRIEQVTRTGPAAYAPKRSRNEAQPIADLIGRLDGRLEQFATASRPAPARPAQPALKPNLPMPPALDRAVAEIIARQRALNGQPAPSAQPTPQRQQQPAPPKPMPRAAMPAPPPPPPAPMLAPVPTQDLSGLEDQLRTITTQIETLRRPGVEEAINALRAELGDIGRTLTEAMPRQAIDAIEKQIHGLTQRIAEGRQAGIDGGALSGVEHGLTEMRDALRGLTPAENLVGFNDAVDGLAHKIDLIVAQQDPATLQQLEHAITTLRDMASHVASNEAVSVLSDQLHALGEKVDQLAQAGAGNDALNSLEHRITALSDALAERAQSGGNVPPMLEALVQSLSDKIEMIQQSRGDNLAVGHLEDRIVSLVTRLDASDSRLGSLEAIERGLADLLVHMEEMRTNKTGGALRAENAAGVVDLKQDIARTHDALEAVHGALGHVVDRLVKIEKDIRGEGRKVVNVDADADFVEPPRPVGKVAVRMVDDAPPLAPQPKPQPVVSVAPPAPKPMAPPPPPAPAAVIAPAAPQPQPVAAPPKRLPPAGRLPIDPDLPPDEPLEPGSGPPAFRANPAARIAASEAALGGPAAASPGGKSGFIAAARRAAQAAVQAPADRAPRPEPIETDDSDASSMRHKMMRRVKSLFIAASIIAVVVGSVQILGNILGSGPSDRAHVKTAAAPQVAAGNADTAATQDDEAEADGDATADAADKPAARPIAKPLDPPRQIVQAAPRSNLAIMPPLDTSAAVQSMPSLLNPPALNTQTGQAPQAKNDVTGSIPRPVRPAAPAPPAISENPLPVTIGSPLLRNAAAAGDPAAAYEVAVRFSEGRGVPASAEEGARWFERAASKGLTPAQFRYASILEKGLGVKKDLVQARKLYLAAAAKGNGKAMHNLAVLYAEGIEGKPDYGTAAQWFRKAALRGIADSQYNLGVLCARGLGTEKNVAESYKWFALAAAQGDRESGKKRDEIATHMDADALAAAEQAVKTFVAEPQPDDATLVHAPPGGWDGAPSASPRGKPRTAGPLALGAFTVGKR